MWSGLIRRVWAGLWSTIGLALAPFFRRRSIVRGALLCEGAGWPRRLGWRYRAITFGHVVLAVDELDPQTFRHELVHVAQYERWGPLFVPVYLLESLRTAIRGRHAYRDNSFEVAARQAAGEVSARRGAGGPADKEQKNLPDPPTGGPLRVD